MRSRWTDFLTSDGEKPGRNRDSEFEVPPKDRDELMRLLGGKVLVLPAENDGVAQ